MSECQHNRIQRSRRRGWRMPADAIYVGRPTAWGNPFVDVAGAVVGTIAIAAGVRIEGRGDCVSVFRLFVLGELPEIQGLTALTDRALDIRKHLDELAGRDLVCWCPLTKRCHADVYLDLCNSTPRRAIDETRTAQAL